MRLRFNLSFLFALLMLPGPGLQAGDRPGDLVLIGGGSRPAVIMEKFIDVAGGRDALILIVPTASSLPDTGDFYIDVFKKDYDCKRVRALTLATREDADSQKTARLVARAGGIFFAGGDQRRILDVLENTLVGEAITEAWQSGTAIAGTSAGTACMSTPMLTGDGDFDVLRADNIVTRNGLGLVPGVILDQHFVARQRQNRLLSLVLENPHLIGVGIDEATAVWFRPDGTWKVLGNGWVQIYDARSARLNRISDRDGDLLGGRQIQMHVLLPGDTFSPNINTCKKD
ncbi:cyanophycinase [Acanthopleuribacter pedis]|uniref:Cyanophycinase n=1 Tax=Acanthopleuribacter pedis TaxID=442870 RepID=A0A8J7QCS6_9BACT|nr:cyanophycinase [Acanthopleuribacter pedis]MBO1323341.1 cyanophycinase [Acanthopleuribacter pedis]